MIDEILDGVWWNGEGYGTGLINTVTEPNKEESIRIALTAIYEIGLGVIGDDREQDFYRDDDYSLMCSTCNEEVFGGICGCSAINELLASQRKVWAKACGVAEK